MRPQTNMQNRATVQRSIESRIFIIRGVKVLLDRDLAALYGVTVKRLNENTSFWLLAAGC